MFPILSQIRKGIKYYGAINTHELITILRKF